MQIITQSYETSKQPDGSWAVQIQLGRGEGALAEAFKQTCGPEWLEGAGGEAQENMGWHSTSRYLRMQIGDSILFFFGETRLDNRQELAKRLGLPVTVRDAEIICHAYAAEGAGFERRLLGDFSFALFDERAQVLRLVRDPLGVCPLYYHLSRERCIASNSLDRLLGHSALSERLEDKVVAEWCLGGHVFNQEDTFFQSVKKCPRATVLRIDRNGLQSEAYWTGDDIAPLRYVDERDYADHLRDLLTTAIVDRMDTTHPLAAHSSGGLDSTPIAIIAGRANRKSGQVFHTFNWSKPDFADAPACDEWDKARKIAQAEGFSHHEIGATAESIKQCFFQHDIARDGTAAFEYERAVLRQAQQLGVNRIFTGFGGDEFLTAVLRDQHYDEIRAGRFVHAFKRLALESDPAQDLRWLRLSAAYARLLFKSMLTRKVLHREFYKFDGDRLRTMRELLNDQFAEFAVTHRRQDANLLVDTITGRQRVMLTAGYHQERMECWAALGRRAGVQYVYPFLDKRIVEFALAIPSDLYFRHGKPRHLYRQALGDTLPDYLQKKLKLAEPERVKQLIREHLKVLADPDVHEMIACADSPYVNTKALLAKCRETRNLNTDNLKHCIVQVTAITTAILTLNINRKRQVPF